MGSKADAASATGIATTAMSEKFKQLACSGLPEAISSATGMGRATHAGNAVM